MTYAVNKSDGSLLVTISNNTIDTSSTSVTLLGRNYSGYGELVAENLVHMVENFSNSSPPSNPLIGQIWHDTSGSSNQLKVYDGASWNPVATVTTDTSEPTGGSEGELWWDTANKQLYGFDGSDWLLIGPPAPSTANASTFYAVITDEGAGTHSALVVVVDEEILGIWSWDSYTAADTTSSIALNGTSIGPNADGTYSGDVLGYRAIVRGLNIATSAKINGTATSADSVSSGALTGYAQKAVNETISGDWLFSGNVTFNNTIQGSINGSAASATNASQLGGVAAANYLRSDTADTMNGNLTMNASILRQSGGTKNIGSSGTPFDIVYATTFNGTATQAQYADLAERFAADDNYDPGTVLVLGGSEEVTISTKVADTNVIGVVSSFPAYLMNNNGPTESNPAIALAGRVPCKVVGKIKKGNRLISSDIPGFARAEPYDMGSSRAIIGRALENKETNEPDIIEILVGIK